jgi:hypothetical protein
MSGIVIVTSSLSYFVFVASRKSKWRSNKEQTCTVYYYRRLVDMWNLHDIYYLRQIWNYNIAWNIEGWHWNGPYRAVSTSVRLMTERSCGLLWTRHLWWRILLLRRAGISWLAQHFFTSDDEIFSVQFVMKRFSTPPNNSFVCRSVFVQRRCLCHLTPDTALHNGTASEVAPAELVCYNNKKY